MSDDKRARSIVIVAFGAAHLFGETLAALDLRERVYVIDNSSDDAVREIAVAAGASYDDPGENLGFARAVNRAFATIAVERPGDDVALLNPDALITSAGLDELHAVFSSEGNERIAAVAPRLKSVDGVEQRAAWPFPSPSAMWREALRLPDRRDQRGFLVGAVLCLRREAIDDVGPFDERYFLYAEETDWQRRAANRGWHGTVSSAWAIHAGAATSTDSERREQFFHSGQETYVRKWFGAFGWQNYRLAAFTGAVIRAVFARSGARRSARERAVLYFRGPRRTAGLGKSSPRRVTHLVVTGNSAGTERYVGQLASFQAALGWDVVVIGGGEVFMRTALPSTVRWLPGHTLTAAAWSLLRLGRLEIVHSHLTTADLLAAATKFGHGARIVSTRHIAKARGNRLPARLIARSLQRNIALEISISEFVAEAICVPSVVVPNGVKSRKERSERGTRRVIVAQRLESEKQTMVALEAWKLAGLANQGWKMTIFGDGSDASEVRRSCRENDVASVECLGWTANLSSEMLAADGLLATAPSEPLGLTVLEAMSVGLPVIAAAGGGHSETVGRVPGGLMFPPGSAEGCAEALKRLASLDEPAYLALQQSSQTLQRKEFDLTTFALRVTNHYG